MESLLILSELGLLQDYTSAAKDQGVCLGKHAEFDDVSIRASTSQVSDEDLHRISLMAPKAMSPGEKVRFLELIAASIPNASTSTSAPLSPVSTASQAMEEFSEDEVSTLSSCTTDRAHWTYNCVLLLLELRRTHEGMFQNSCITQKQAWRKVSEEMVKKGYKVNGEECSKKFLNLKQRHRTIKERNKRTGNSRLTWPFMDIMNDMFAGDPAVTPMKKVGSLRREASLGTSDDHPTTIPVTSVTPSSGSSTTSSATPATSSATPATSSATPATSSATPATTRKRRRSDEEPNWISSFRSDMRDMHDQRMVLDSRKVSALERLVAILEQQQ